jgi:CelD/BcsL family acetyltransferase involved in cellulose biosynthesis
MEEVGPQWAALADSAALNPSIKPQWMNAVLRSHQVEHLVRVAELTDESQFKAYIPFIYRTVKIAGLPLRCCDLASNVVSYHAELVGSGQVEKAIEFLLTDQHPFGWDVMRFDNLPVGSASARLIKSVAGSLGFKISAYAGQSSPYLPISRSWEDYTQCLSKKMRANIARAHRTVEQSGSVEMMWYENGADTDQLLSAILAVEERSWKSDEGTAIQSNIKELDYYRRLLPSISASGIFANVLLVNGKPSAYVLCAHAQGWVGQLKTSFDQKLRDAGFRVIQASIQRAFERGFREYDFLGDAAPHKLRWSDHIRPHESVWIYAGHWRGRAWARLKQWTDIAKSRPSQTPAAGSL